MTLQEKYRSLTEKATSSGVADLKIREQDGVLYIDGTAPSGQAKDALWDSYSSIDPDFRSGDLVMNINVSPTSASTQAKVVTESSNLNIRKGPGTDQPIVGKAAHGETITVLSRSNEQWWLVRTKDGEEGYAYSRYLQDA